MISILLLLTTACCLPQSSGAHSFPLYCRRPRKKGGSSSRERPSIQQRAMCGESTLYRATETLGYRDRRCNRPARPHRLQIHPPKRKISMKVSQVRNSRPKVARRFAIRFMVPAQCGHLEHTPAVLKEKALSCKRRAWLS